MRICCTHTAYDFLAGRIVNAVACFLYTLFWLAQPAHCSASSSKKTHKNLIAQMSNNTCCVLLLMKLDAAADQKVCCMTLLATTLIPTLLSICCYFSVLHSSRADILFIKVPSKRNRPKELICFEGKTIGKSTHQLL